jgi:predicted small lipoprotein YifL
MNTMKPFAVVAILAFAATIAACHKEGPLEKAGKKVDNAVEKAGDKIKDATSK